MAAARKPKAQLTARERGRLLDALATGRSLRDVAREFGVSATTAHRIREGALAAAPSPAATPPAPVHERARALAARLTEARPAPPEAAEPPEVFESGDLLAEMRGMLHRTQRMAREAAAAGNHTAAQRLMRDTGNLANTIARLERETRASGEGITATRADIEKAMGDLQLKAAALLDRPLLCAECGRTLSVEWGGALDKVNDSNAREAARENKKP